MKRSELKQLIREAIEDLTEKKPTEKDPEGHDRPEGEDYDAEGASLTEKAKEKKKLGVQLPDDVPDEVGSFYVVEKPGEESTLADIIFECPDVAYFANQIRGGVRIEDIKGVFVKEAKAKKLADKLIKERDDAKQKVKQAAEAYKKMKAETLAKVQEYMKNKKATVEVVDELKDITKED